MIKKHSNYVYRRYIFISLGVILLFTALILVFNTVDAVKHTITKAEKAPAATMQMNDFPTAEEGTFIGVLPEKYFKEEMDNVIILFASAKIPGLTLMYYPEQKRLVGGTPQLAAENIYLFDGQKHELKYSFKKNGPQSLFYDNKLIASGDFRPAYPLVITGLAIGFIDNHVSDAFVEVDIS